MPTVIDQLVVELGLDPSKFTQGQREAVEAYNKMLAEMENKSKVVEAQGRKTEQMFSDIKKQALGLLAAVMGGRGIAQFAAHMTQLDAAAGRTAHTLRMAIPDLSAWQGVARQTGGTAESMAGSMQGLTDQVNRFMLTGEGSFLPILNVLKISLFDANKQLKTAGTLFLDIAKAVEGMDPDRARALMQSLGIDPQTINTLLLGEQRLKNLVAAQREVGVASRESATEAQKLQSAWNFMLTWVEEKGRKLLQIFGPMFRSVMGFGMWAVDKGSNLLFGTPMLQPLPGGANQTLTPSLQSATQAEREAYIRKAAAARGIDPNVAVAVAKSEGLGADYQSTVRRRDGSREPSFGDFQLFMGGGLGNEFQKKTGLDPRDPSTWRQQTDFSLDHASKNGWGAWHGWKGLPFAGIGGMPQFGAGVVNNRGGDSSSSTTNVQVGQVVVQTQATDADGIARDLKPALERSNWASGANYGLR